MARVQKCIAKWIDKDGKTVDFERFSTNNIKKISNVCIELNTDTLIASKDTLSNFDFFKVFETEPDGTNKKLMLTIPAHLYLESVANFYKKKHEHFPYEDKFDAAKWKEITDKRAERMENRKVKELEIDFKDIDDMLNLKSENVVYKLKINGLEKKDLEWNDDISNLTRDLQNIYRKKGFLFDLSEIKLPNDLTDMSGTFCYCESLVKAPKIPNGVIDMAGAFFCCKNLLEVPVIPKEVKSIFDIFNNCEKLNTAEKFQDTFKKLSNSKVPVLDISKKMTSWMNFNEKKKLDEMFKDMGVKSETDLEKVLFGWKDEFHKELKKDMKQEKKIEKDVRSR